MVYTNSTERQEHRLRLKQMQFAERHEEIIKKVGPIIHWKAWFKTIAFSLVALALGAAYLWYRGGKFDWFYFNQALACSAVFLIGCSYILSAICYFWNFLDTKIIYRKYLGIIGAVFGLCHIIVIIFTQQRRFDADWFFKENLWQFLAGLAALMIFALMVLISNRYLISELGSTRWRKTLRYTGYGALLLVFLHIVFILWARWQMWWTSFKPWLPPLSLVVAVFIVVVFVFRIALAIALWRHQQKAAPITAPVQK